MATTTTGITRDEAISRIRAGLKKRTGVAWSVTAGRGTASAWINVMSPAARAAGRSMTEEECASLAAALGLDASKVHHQGWGVGPNRDRLAAVERAETGATEIAPEEVWD